MNQAVDSPARLDWTDHTQTAPFTIKLRTPRKEFYWVKGLGVRGVKSMRPCDANWKKEDQAELVAKIKRATAHYQEEGEHVIVEERYTQPQSGFPGRLWSPGCQGLCRPIRSNLLSETADADMKNAQPKTIIWTCKDLQAIETPVFEDYCTNRDVRLEKIMDDLGVSKAKAKKLVIATLNSRHKLNAKQAKKCEYLKKLDVEAKKIQAALMARPELQWILPFCKDDKDNVPGSFISQLYDFIENKLLMRVYRLLVEEMGYEVAALVFDGLNLADKSLHNNQSILDRAKQACEEVCPGIDMEWAWKELDFTVESADKREKIKNADGSVKEFRVPAEFVPPPLNGHNSTPTYEELREQYSLNNGDKPKVGLGKVGCVFIEVNEEGKIETYDTTHLKVKFGHVRYFYTDQEGKQQKGGFIDEWMRDNRMDAAFIPDASKRYFWEEFTMCPKVEECPPNKFNLWGGFAAEKIEANYDADAREGLVKLLKFVAMLLNQDPLHYDFLLDILAHTVQYPEIKLGIAIGLVGKQGTGKSFMWSIIERLIGQQPDSKATYVTAKPEKNVYGDNNPNIREALFCRITEVNQAKMARHVGELRTYITDFLVETRSLYCKAFDIANFTRFFFDTNFLDALPDDPDERRFFIVKVCEEMLNNTEYFEELDSIVNDDSVIRALFDFLKARPVKERYGKNDIPKGEFQSTLKDCNRSEVDHFVKWLVLEQDAELETVRLKDDTVATRYIDYKGGEEAQNNKRSILRKLELSGIDGVNKPHDVRETIEDQFGNSKTKWVTYYHFDLTVLRQRYKIGGDDDEAEASVSTVEKIDCEKDVADWEARRDGRPAPVVGKKRGRDAEDDSGSDSDDECDDGEEFGRRAYLRGEMPSPGDSAAMVGWHKARAEAFPGPANCPEKGAHSDEERSMCPYCA